jgi:predicted O-methyltransferase YrrM
VITITPSNESLDKVQYIAEKMEGRPFHFHSHLLYDIRSSLGNQTINYLEIGTAYGMTVSLVASHPYTTNCYAIDLGFPEGVEVVVEKNVNTFKNKTSTFTYIKGNSREVDVINRLKSQVDTFDFIFIDGDHAFNGVIQDFNNYGNLLRPGGVLVFDDYLDEWDSPGVRPAVDKIVDDNKENFHILGTLKYPLIDTFSEKIKSSNLFIMVKL